METTGAKAQTEMVCSTATVTHLARLVERLEVIPMIMGISFAVNVGMSGVIMEMEVLYLVVGRIAQNAGQWLMKSSK